MSLSHAQRVVSESRQRLSHRLALLTLAVQADGAGQWRGSIMDLARITDLTERRVTTILQELEHGGEITVERYEEGVTVQLPGPHEIERAEAAASPKQPEAHWAGTGSASFLAACEAWAEWLGLSGADMHPASRAALKRQAGEMLRQGVDAEAIKLCEEAWFKRHWTQRKNPGDRPRTPKQARDWIAECREDGLLEGDATQRKTAARQGRYAGYIKT